jgi:hypothetical protein
MMPHPHSMSVSQAPYLNSVFRRHLRAGLSPFDAMNAVSVSHHLEAVGGNYEGKLFRDQAGELAVCW